MKPQELRAKAKLIKDMDSAELDEFSREVSLSKVDHRARFFLFEEIDKRREKIEINKKQRKKQQLKMKYITITECEHLRLLNFYMENRIIVRL